MPSWTTDPGFCLHHCNDMHALAMRAGELIAAEMDRRHPLYSPTVVVPHPGIARWLQITLATASSVCANVRFVQPGSCFWGLAHRHYPDLPDEATYSQERLTWRSFATLTSTTPRQESIGHPDSRPDPIARYQLAVRLGRMYSDYQLYRPDWMAGSGSSAFSAHWTGRLWQAMGQSGQHGLNPGVVFAWLPQFIREADQSSLPDGLILLGISHLPPVLIDVLSALASRRPVHMLTLSPSETYWQDLRPERRQLRERLRGDPYNPDASRHPLLASLGEQLQDFHLGLAESGLDDSLPEGDELPYRAGVPGTLLGAMQDSLRYGDVDAVRGQAINPDDRSIQVFRAYSELREVQALHDRILDAMVRAEEAGQPLRAREIIVIAPAIETYAPYIRAVFGPQRLGLPKLDYNVVDRPTLDEHPVIRAFHWLLATPVARVSASEVLALLEVPAVQRRFRLGATDLSSLRRTIARSNVRWGLDAAHREELGAAASSLHTWRHTIEQWLIGFAAGETNRQLVAGRVRPNTRVESDEARQIGQLARMIELVGSVRIELKKARTAQKWQEFLQREVKQGFFEFASNDRSEVHARKAIDDALDYLSHAADELGNLALEWSVVRQAIAGRLAERLRDQPLMSGGITFAHMIPMRSIPARMICVLGLGNGHFPRIRRSPEFDLAAARPRRCDRSLTADDRYLFLETLLAARDQLVLSFVGRDPRDDSPREPSPLVRELIDLADQIAPGSLPIDDEPLQPFDAALFDGQRPKQQSFHAEWLPAAKGIAQPSAPFFTMTWPQPQTLESLDLDELRNFLKNPTGHCLSQRHGILLDDFVDDVVDDFEDTQDGIAAWAFRTELVSRLLADPQLDPATLPDRWWLESGDLPPLPLAKRHVIEATASCVDMVDRIRTALHGETGPDPQTLFVDEPIAVPFQDRHVCLQGQVDGVCPASGMVRWHVGKPAGKRMAQVLADYLTANLVRPTRLVYVHLETNDDFTLAGTTPDYAKAALAGLLELYARGIDHPIPLMPNPLWEAQRDIRQTYRALLTEFERNEASRLLFSPEVGSDMVFGACRKLLFGWLETPPEAPSWAP